MKITIKELRELFEAAEHLPISPDYKQFPVYVITDVVDLDKSVRWNRQEIRKRMAIRNEEANKLKEIKRAAIQDAHQQALAYIMQETGMSYEQATIFWDFVISDFRSHTTDLWTQLNSLIGLLNSLK